MVFALLLRAKCTLATSVISHGGNIVLRDLLRNRPFTVELFDWVSDSLETVELAAAWSRCWPRNKETPGVTSGLREFYRTVGFISRVCPNTRAYWTCLGKKSGR